MRDKFKEHHKLTDEERQLLWSEAVFVFDTNVLLNIYRYADATRADLFKLMKALDVRIWIPHQVAKEFYANRIDVIQEQKSKYEEIVKAIESPLMGLGNYRKSAFLDIDEIESIIKPSIDSAKEKLKAQQENHPDLLRDDLYLEELSGIIGDRIGEDYSAEMLPKILSEAKLRIESKCPPGYKDAKKPEPERYGDVLIWFQILDFSEKSTKPIIFVTEDEKEDWWLIIDGQKLGVRPELRREMRLRSQREFYITRPATLFEEAGKLLQVNIPESSVSDAKEVAAELTESKRPFFSFGLSESSHQIKKRPDMSEVRREHHQRLNEGVYQWLKNKYRTSDVIVSNVDRIDFIIHGGHGGQSRIAVDLMPQIHQPSSMLLRRIKDIFLQAFYLVSSGKYTEFLLIIAASDIDVALDISPYARRALKDQPAFPICIGVVEKFDSFEEMETLQP